MIQNTSPFLARLGLDVNLLLPVDIDVKPTELFALLYILVSPVVVASASIVVSQTDDCKLTL